MSRGRVRGGIAAPVVFVFSVLGLAACGGGAFDIPEFDFFDEPIDFGPTTREKPDVSMVVSGKAVCAWVGDGHVYAERLVPGYGWTDYVQMDASPAAASPPQVSMGRSGAAVVVWEQDGQVVANCFDVNTGWRGAEPISDPSAPEASEPRLGSADDGTAIVVWEQDGGVVGAKFDPVRGWDAPAPIAVPASHADDVQLSVPPSGNAVVVWNEGDVDVVASTFDAATQTWSLPELIGAGDTPRVAADDLGNGIVVFAHDGDVVSVAHDPVAGWQAPITVPVPSDVAGVTASASSVDLGPGGKGGVVFDLGGEVYASPYEIGAGFEEAQPIAPGIVAAGDLEMAVDEEGNAFAAFEDVGGHVHTVTYRAVYDDWLEPRDGGRGQDPAVSVSDDGRAITVWVDGGYINVVSVRELDPTTPVRLSVSVQGQGQVVSDPAGVDCLGGVPCEMYMPFAASVRLMATPLPGFRFSHWNGIAASPLPNPSVEFSMAEDLDAEAVFVPDP